MNYGKSGALASLAILAALILSACSQGLVASWKAPNAAPFQMNGEKVAAVVMAEDESLRRAAEDALARELSARGAVGIPMYTLLPNAGPNDEPAAKAAAERAGIVGIVVMRPVRVDKEISSTPSSFSGPMHPAFWGSYYGYGWGASYGGEIRTDTIVTIETLVYSLAQNQLVWGGQSKTTNPANVGRVIEDTAKRVADELVRQGLLRSSVQTQTPPSVTARFSWDPWRRAPPGTNAIGGEAKRDGAAALERE
jgi:hypothetical protein